MSLFTFLCYNIVMAEKIRVVSLFSGIGGFEHGISNTNLVYQIVMASEIDKYASIAYSSNFNPNLLKQDIREIKNQEIPDHDLLVAGFPCQAFSISGKRLGFEDTRGTLFFEIARILKAKTPKYILLENVKNLISHNHSNTIKTIIEILSDIGYSLDFTVINSSEAGLAQNRERTYILGIYNYLNQDIKKDKRSKKVLELKKEINYRSFNFFDDLCFNNNQLYLQNILETEVDKKYYFQNNELNNYLNNLELDLDTNYQNKIVKVLDLDKTIHNDLERQRRVYSIYGIAPTILARSDSSKILIKYNHQFKLRKLTERESFRIQGFDEQFIDNILNNPAISMTQAYKQAGNAVSPPVIQGIIQLLKDKYIDPKPITFIDLFCGLGGFRLALESLNAQCVFSCDIDSKVQEVYYQNFLELPQGDISKIESQDIADHDILCAGFPCQPFSSAGKRLGFEDTRGTLFFEVARILKDKKPKAFILENVKGIVSHNQGRSLKVILNILSDLGYDYKCAVLNAKDYGIAQNRERWYCVGVRKELNIEFNNFNFPPKELLEFDLTSIIEETTDERYKISKICNSNLEKHIKLKSIEVNDFTIASEIRPSRCVFNQKGIVNCLTAKMGTGGSNVPVLVAKKRKLTERECLSLMGFPQSYKINPGYQTYKQIGNSVVVPLIKKIADRLIEILK